MEKPYRHGGLCDALVDSRDGLVEPSFRRLERRTSLMGSSFSLVAERFRPVEPSFPERAHSAEPVAPPSMHPAPSFTRLQLR
jgi:hypothetical protein